MAIIPLYKTWVEDVYRIKIVHKKVALTMQKSSKHFLLLSLLKQIRKIWLHLFFPFKSKYTFKGPGVEINLHSKEEKKWSEIK